MKFYGYTIVEVPIAGHYYSMVLTDEKNWYNLCEDFKKFKNGTVLKCIHCEKYKDTMEILFEGMDGTSLNIGQNGYWHFNIMKGSHFIEKFPLYIQEEMDT